MAVQKRYDAKVQKEQDSRLVKGLFEYTESPGGRLEFSYKAHKGEPVKRYELDDNTVYELPIGVAKHLNQNGWYPIHQHTQDEHGKPAQRIGTKVSRFSFRSLEFYDAGEFNVANSLYTVEQIPQLEGKPNVKPT